jgi:transcriptional regulator with XRE-family HTH domain
VIRIEDINKKIKKIRKEKNITLKELSKYTGLSISFLSQVERGVSSFTITSLKKISEGLGVSLQEIVSYEEENNFITKKENPVYLRLQNNYYSHQIVSGKFDGRKLEGIIYTIKPNCKMDAFAHDGEEFHYILQGKALFSIGDSEYELEEGETIHFPSILEHKIECIGNKDLKILSVLTPTIF